MTPPTPLIGTHRHGVSKKRFARVWLFAEKKVSVLSRLPASRKIYVFFLPWGRTLPTHMHTHTHTHTHRRAVCCLCCLNSERTRCSSACRKLCVLVSRRKFCFIFLLRKVTFKTSLGAMHPASERSHQNMPQTLFPCSEKCVCVCARTCMGKHAQFIRLSLLAGKKKVRHFSGSKLSCVSATRAHTLRQKGSFPH